MSSKSILITGCSKGGIGSELAFAFQKAGLTVFATARMTGKIDPALVKLPNVEVLELDVASSASISAAAKAIDSRLNGRLDILVNNSGVGVPGPIAEIDLKEAKKMFDVNLWGVLEVTQAFMPMLVRAKGVVVNNSSVGGFMHMPFNGVYGASKAAVVTIGEALRLELAPYGVKVVTLATGGVKTEFFSNMQQLDLRPDSMYKKIESNARDSLNGKGKESMVMPAKKYAEAVVHDILAGANGIVWRGGGASFIKYVTGFLPTFILDRLLVSGIGFEKLS
ncbi:hypothetical protein MMC18_008466 [Xylographa bjoerkii]|nr:hypothetical protein [Xylographa bjoerkii]